MFPTLRIARHAIFLLFVTAWAVAAGAAETTAPHGPGYDDFARVLSTHVDERGLVDYRALKADRAPLDAFITRMAELDRATYDAWPEDARIAFWLNAYNGLTLQTIIDHYPIEAGLLGGLRFPDNSIRQIDDVWSGENHTVMGRRISLDHIEHEILRKDFDEPRIHMALVCAAMGCPELRGEPYVGARLDAQLDDQTDTFVRDPRKFRIDRDDDRVYVSSIFDWFGEDFIGRYLPEHGFEGHSAQQRAFLNFHAQYLDDADARYLRHGDYKVRHLNYDWSLNEQ